MPLGGVAFKGVVLEIDILVGVAVASEGLVFSGVYLGTFPLTSTLSIINFNFLTGGCELGC